MEGFGEEDERHKKREEKGTGATFVRVCGPERLGSNGRPASCRLHKQLRHLEVSDSQGHIGRRGQHYNAISVLFDTETLLDERISI